MGDQGKRAKIIGKKNFYKLLMAYAYLSKLEEISSRYSKKVDQLISDYIGLEIAELNTLPKEKPEYIIKTAIREKDIDQLNEVLLSNKSSQKDYYIRFLEELSFIVSKYKLNIFELIDSKKDKERFKLLIDYYNKNFKSKLRADYVSALRSGIRHNVNVSIDELLKIQDGYEKNFTKAQRKAQKEIGVKSARGIFREIDEYFDRMESQVNRNLDNQEKIKIENDLRLILIKECVEIAKFFTTHHPESDELKSLLSTKKNQPN